MKITRYLQSLAFVACCMACAVAFQSLRRTDDIWFDEGLGERK